MPSHPINGLPGSLLQMRAGHVNAPHHALFPCLHAADNALAGDGSGVPSDEGVGIGDSFPSGYFY
jgi:hypothetical protein